MAFLRMKWKINYCASFILEIGISMAEQLLIAYFTALSE